MEVVLNKQGRRVANNCSLILDRYTLIEFLGPFLFCVIGLTVILLSTLLFELVEYIIVKNVSAVTVSKMLLYKIPELMVMTLPMASLFATLFALGRLNQDSELKVMRSSGIPYRRIMLPIIIAGFLISCLTFVTNEKVVPWTNHEFEKTFREILFRDGLPMVDENVFFAGGDDRFFYINKIDQNTNEFQRIMIYEVERNNFPRLITAETGTYQANNWFLNDGIVQELDSEGFVSYQTRFEAMQIITPEDAELYFGNQRTTDEMNRKELKEHIERFQKSGLRVVSFVVDYHLKLALPMASFIFVLFGAPLSIYSRGGRSFGIAVSLVVTLVFYVANSVTRSLGVNEVLPPLAAAWLTNSLFAVVGGILLMRIDRLH